MPTTAKQRTIEDWQLQNRDLLNRPGGWTRLAWWPELKESANRWLQIVYRITPWRHVVIMVCFGLGLGIWSAFVLRAGRSTTDFLQSLVVDRGMEFLVAEIREKVMIAVVVTGSVSLFLLLVMVVWQILRVRNLSRAPLMLDSRRLDRDKCCGGPLGCSTSMLYLLITLVIWVLMLEVVVLIALQFAWFGYAYSANNALEQTQMLIDNGTYQLISDVPSLLRKSLSMQAELLNLTRKFLPDDANVTLSNGTTYQAGTFYADVERHLAKISATAEQSNLDCPPECVDFGFLSALLNLSNSCVCPEAKGVLVKLRRLSRNAWKFNIYSIVGLLLMYLSGLWLLMTSSMTYVLVRRDSKDMWKGVKERREKQVRREMRRERNHRPTWREMELHAPQGPRADEDNARGKKVAHRGAEEGLTGQGQPGSDIEVGQDQKLALRDRPEKRGSLWPITSRAPSIEGFISGGPEAGGGGSRRITQFNTMGGVYVGEGVRTERYSEVELLGVNWAVAGVAADWANLEQGGVGSGVPRQVAGSLASEGQPHNAPVVGPSSIKSKGVAGHHVRDDDRAGKRVGFIPGPVPAGSRKIRGNGVASGDVKIETEITAATSR